MKVKLLISSALISLVSINSFALEIHKGKLVGHKEWTAGNVKGASFKPNPSKPVGLKQDQKGDAQLFVYSVALPSTFELSSLQLMGQSFLHVSNNTLQAQTYAFTFSICGNITEHTSNCAYYRDDITLEPGGSVSESVTPILLLDLKTPGTYPFSVSVSVDSDDASTASLNGYSTSSSTFTVG